MDPLTVSALVTGGATVVSAFGQNQANNANIAQSDKQMRFQKHMDDTKYRRHVYDLEQAGLNPMLAYGNLSGGTPSGSMARIDNVAKDFPRSVSTASQVALAKKELDIKDKTLSLKDKELDLMDKNIDRQGAESDRVRSVTDLNRIEKDIKSHQVVTEFQRGNLVYQQGKTEASRSKLVDSQASLTKYKSEVARWAAHSAAEVEKKKKLTAIIDRKLSYIDAALKRLPGLKKIKR